MNFFKHYLIALIVFTLIDLIWLLIISKDLYREKLGPLMADKVNILAAVLFYVLFIAAVVFFVINPAIEKESIFFALYAGAFFGLVCYATYDLTNLATLKGWPLSITIIDLIWGSFITSATSVISTWLIGKI
ncbi:MAG: DUF2177 family protein [Clostridia bacterium]|nr:DUF2177 family protein [Clostridia bacterium]